VFIKENRTVPKLWILGLTFALLGMMTVPLQARAQTPTPSTTLSSDTKVTPEKVAAAVAQLEQLTQDEMKATGIPGISIAVVYQDKPVLVKGLGVREEGKSDPVDADTVFQLASVSKPLGSTVIAGLVSNGALSWDDLVTKYDPGFQLHDPYVTSHVTIHDLYAHRSGLPDHIGDLLEDIGYDRATILERLRYVPLDNHFRSHYAYTNFGLTEGGIAAAKAAGKTWEQLSEDRLYKPLNMTETSSTYSDFINNPNHASGHMLIDGKWVAKQQRQPDAQSPAGGGKFECERHGSVAATASWTGRD
jgi:CubicO group peptidase (beta-lactamase class C family)